METAGRSVVFSGRAVALGLALLLAMPLPFMRMMGVAGFLIPLVSIAAAVDAPARAALALRPARRRAQADPARRAASTPSRASGRGSRARSWRGRSLFLAIGGDGADRGRGPGVRHQLTPGLDVGIPRTPQSVQGFDVLERGGRPGRGRAVDRARDARAAARCSTPEVAGARSGGSSAELRARPARWRGRLLRAGPAATSTPRGQLPQVIVAGRHEYGPRGAGVRHAAARRARPGGGVPGGRRGARRRRAGAGRGLPRPRVQRLPAGSSRPCWS